MWLLPLLHWLGLAVLCCRALLALACLASCDVCVVCRVASLCLVSIMLSLRLPGADDVLRWCRAARLLQVAWNGQNVAQGKPATALDAYGRLANYVASKATDGKTNTFYASNSINASTYLLVDLQVRWCGQGCLTA